MGMGIRHPTCHMPWLVGCFFLFHLAGLVAFAALAPSSCAIKSTMYNFPSFVLRTPQSLGITIECERELPSLNPVAPFARFNAPCSISRSTVASGSVVDVVAVAAPAGLIAPGPALLLPPPLLDGVIVLRFRSTVTSRAPSMLVPPLRCSNTFKIFLR